MKKLSFSMDISEEQEHTLHQIQDALKGKDLADTMRRCMILGELFVEMKKRGLEFATVKNGKIVERLDFKG